MTEALGSADPTLFAEIKQLNGGKMTRSSEPRQRSRHRSSSPRPTAVGRVEVRRQLPRRQPGHRDERPGIQGVLQGAAGRAGQGSGTTGDFTTYLSAPGGVHLYDGINLAGAGDDQVARAPARACTAGHHQDRGRRPRRKVVYSFAPGRGGPQGRQDHQVRGARRADQLRQLPRLDRASSRSTPTARPVR